MRVFDVMTPNVVSVLPETTLMDAALVMRNLDVGALPVLDEGSLVGIVTDRDIAARAVAEGHDPRLARVLEVMSTDVVTCHESDEVRQAARLMQDAQVRRLVVTNGGGEVAGIVSLGDVVRLTNDPVLAGQTLERISEPAWVKS